MLLLYHIVKHVSHHNLHFVNMCHETKSQTQTMINVIKLSKSCTNTLSPRTLHTLEMLVTLHTRYIGGVC